MENSGSFKEGNRASVGNNGGRPKLSELERSAREMLREKIAAALLLIMPMTREELDNAIKEGGCNGDKWDRPTAYIARCWQKGERSGETRHVQYWIDRMLGRPREHVILDSDPLPSVMRAAEAQQWKNTIEERARQAAAQWPAGNPLDA
jgi:hypothetical protein